MPLWKKIFLVITLICYFNRTLLLSVYANEEDPGLFIPNLKITHLEQGESAPYSGILLTQESLLKIEQDNVSKIDLLKLDYDKQLKLLDAKSQLEISSIKIEKEAIEQKYTQIVSLKDEHIKFLNKQLSKNSGNNNVLIFSLGVGAGILLMFLSAVAYEKIASSSSNN